MRKIQEVGICPKCKCSLSMFKTSNYKRFVKCEVSEFCEKCRRCIQLCPVNAIYDNPILRECGNLSRIEGEKCMEYFYKTTGCSVCIQVCPFHKIGYEVMHYSRL